MKKISSLLAAFVVILASSCYNSQFSTTTRHYKNGKASYDNHYLTKKDKISKINSPKSHLKETTSQNNAFPKSDLKKSAEPEITKINPVAVSDAKNLIASTSNEPAIIGVNENRVVTVNDLILSLKKHYGFNSGEYNSDTIKDKKSKKRTNSDTIPQYVIKFKNGQKETVKIIYHSHDTLKYHLINEPNVVQTVLTEQIDTIIQVKSYSGEEYVVRKTEPLGIIGFLFTLLGLIPVLGIPFAILAIIFLTVSLGKIRRHPEKFKGKKLVIAGLIIWEIGLIVYIILLFTGAFSM